MEIYLISQSVNNNYDTYASAVAIAENADAARLMHPCSGHGWGYRYTSWALKPEQVVVEHIGTALPTEDKPQFVCKSFNAG